MIVWMRVVRWSGEMETAGGRRANRWASHRILENGRIVGSVAGRVAGPGKDIEAVLINTYDNGVNLHVGLHTQVNPEIGNFGLREVLENGFFSEGFRTRHTLGRYQFRVQHLVDVGLVAFDHVVSLIIGDPV